MFSQRPVSGIGYPLFTVLEPRLLLSTVPAEIHGILWNDLDGNGVRDSGEGPLAGWTVYLDLNNNGNPDDGEPSALTGDGGSYTFAGLAAGTYTVAEVPQAGWAPTQSTRRISMGYDGSEPDDHCFFGSMSEDGRYVAFRSSATNLVEADPKPYPDQEAIYIYDGQTGTIEDTGIVDFGNWAFSANGRYIAFSSAASNLVPGDTNGVADVFVLDLQTRSIQRVSLAADGTQANSDCGSCTISGNGQHVAFISYASNLAPGDTSDTRDLFVYDCTTGEIHRATAGIQDNGILWSPNAISYDGRFVTFSSTSSTLVPGDLQGHADVFVYDCLTSTTQRVSVASDGTEGNGEAWNPAISDDGRYVAFESYSSNLVPGDTNGAPDIFVYDRQTGVTERVSVASDGTQADTGGQYPFISGDGRYVGFVSEATNLVPGRARNSMGLYVHDRLTGTLRQVNVADDGTPGDNASWSGTLSRDGQYVAFEAYATNLVPGDTNGLTDVYLKRLFRSQTVTVAAGQVVADVDFGQRQTVGVITGRLWNDLDHDNVQDESEPPLAGWTVYIDRNGNDTLDAGEITALTDATGTYTFTGLTPATYTVGVVPQAGWTQMSWDQSTTYPVGIVSDPPVGSSNNSSYWSYISGDGRYVAFTSMANDIVPGDGNHVFDVFVYDRQTQSTERVSLAANGTEGNEYSVDPSLSDDGRYVAFRSMASNLVAGDANGRYDIYVYDRQTGQPERITVAAGGGDSNGDSWYPILSGDGRYVTFCSSATNLVTEDTNGVQDVFVYDRQTGSMQRVSISSGGTQGNGSSANPRVSGNGRYVVFQSDATNLVPGDTNGRTDVFVYDRQTGLIERVGGIQGNAASAYPSISGDGRYVAFQSDASNLVPGDTNGLADVFVYDRLTGDMTQISNGLEGTQGNGTSSGATISRDGRSVAFQSEASNLVSGDTNGWKDIFVWNRLTGTTRRVSVAADGSQGDNYSTSPTITNDGRYVAFCSQARTIEMSYMMPYVNALVKPTFDTWMVSVQSARVTEGADFGLHARPSSWTGQQGSEWNDAGNWVGQNVPSEDVTVTFSGTPSENQPVLGQDQIVQGLGLLGDGWTLDLAGHTLSVGTGGLGIADAAKIDLGDGNLIVAYDGESPLKTIEAWVKAGGGTQADGEHFAWDGAGGITTSAIVGDENMYRSLGIRDNGFPLANRFHMTDVDGVAVPAQSVVVKYTWIGDMDLDGAVTVNDYLEFLHYYSENPPPEDITWMTGDFNYDGKINVNDYLMLLAGYAAQSEATPGTAQPAATETAAETVAPATPPAETTAPAAEGNVVDLLRKAGGTRAMAGEAAAATPSGPGSQADLIVQPAADGGDSGGEPILAIAPTAQESAVLHV